MVHSRRSLKILATLTALTSACLLGQIAHAESCQATQTSVTDAPAESAAATPTTINSQDINLEKSFMQDGGAERALYSTRDGDLLGKEIFISATVDTVTGDTTLIIRDLRSGLSANAAGGFGNDGIIATSLSGVINGIQKLITLTCQK